MSEVNLYGRVIITGNIRVLTGLRIGTEESSLSIGGVDNPVVRNLISGQPYIPGSSLKGKMRSLTEKLEGAPQNRRIGKAMIHVAGDEAQYRKYSVNPIYGVMASEERYARPTRLVVRDVNLTPESAAELAALSTDLPYTEVKWEVAIDRVTSMASPRQMERVPAGAVFGPFEFVFSLYEPTDPALFARVLDGMSLLQDDYLGGTGSRGSGKIAFEKIRLQLKRRDNYLAPETLVEEEETLDALIGRLPEIIKKLQAAVGE